MLTRVSVSLLLLALVIACSNPAPEPVSAAKTPVDEVVEEPVSPPAGEPDEAPTTPKPDSEPEAAKFPPPDLSCTQDSECDTHFRYLTDDGRCCGSCTHEVGNVAWVKAVMAVCEARSQEGCPMKKCKAADPVRCVESKCTFAP